MSKQLAMISKGRASAPSPKLASQFATRRMRAEARQKMREEVDQQIDAPAERSAEQARTRQAPP